MKRIVLSVFALFLVSLGAIAQVEISPGTLVLEAEDVDQIYMDIVITNNNSEPIDIYWNYEQGEGYPSDWKTQLCDLNLCYNWNSFSSSASLPNVIDAGQEVVFTIKVKNNVDEMINISGNSYGILRLYDDAEKTNEVAATSSVISSTNNVSVEDLVIYPNPTTESFQLKNDNSVSSISIYNIVGRLVKSFNHSDGMIHDVTTLRTGMYLVRLEDKNGDVLKSMRLSKK